MARCIDSAALYRNTFLKEIYNPGIGAPISVAALRYSVRWGISGKPDCFIRTANGVVPVEFKKSRKAPARGGVYPNHSIQVLAYCALVEDQMHVRVAYGLVIYAGQQLRRVEYNDANKRWLAGTIEAVRHASGMSSVTRNHQLPARCSGCGLRASCSQRLV